MIPDLKVAANNQGITKPGSRSEGAPNTLGMYAVWACINSRSAGNTRSATKMKRGRSVFDWIATSKVHNVYLYQTSASLFLSDPESAEAVANC